MADSSSSAAAVVPAENVATNKSAKNMILKSKIEPQFSIKIGPSVINCCSILKNVEEHTDNSDAVEVEMTQKQLEKFVALHEHFADSEASNAKDLEWTNKFFAEMTEEEFKDLCWKADYLDSQRFLEASGDFVLHLLEDMEVPAIQKYLNIVDDYTPEERKAMEEHPLEFFTGVSIQQDEAEQQAAAAAAGGDAPAADPQ